MSVITSPNVLKRMSLHLPAKVNVINPSFGSNSTCPLPQSNKPLEKKDSQFKVSHDTTMLYELFSSLVSPKLPLSQGAVGGRPICLCCERKITGQVCQPSHRQHEASHNKTTSALFYGSHHVKKYMQHVMTRNNMTDIINCGFPCPHIALENVNIPLFQYYCEHCEYEKKQDTIRLTLTPTHCRADDDKIYTNAYTTPHQDQHQSKRMKKRRGCIFLFIRQTL
ncbi:ATP-dependent DNA helicase II subunit 1 [Mucor velutinosus]|uniref:ATP-dependent DNA helicase II subunit 1 n=1 Tax=Mucor velutinosus TaxID=708070 RepID=A0AAN7HP68_9FUNG|nr:ATP-dependent DNA helicase II subunit 1 [Mucor velutinosus]